MSIQTMEPFKKEQRNEKAIKVTNDLEPQQSMKCKVAMANDNDDGRRRKYVRSKAVRTYFYYDNSDRFPLFLPWAKNCF
jgi:hypothetical protein